MDLGALLLDACPTLRRQYCAGSETVDGLSAICALMREEQAG